MHDQISPAACTRVAGRYRRSRQRPGDREVRVVVRDGEVLGGIMRTIDPIAHIGGRRQCLEAVQEAGWHVQMTKVVVVEQERLLPTECWRVAANVDKHVVHGTVGTPDQLRLATTRTAVHAANDSFGRTGLGVLDERRGEPGRAEVAVEDVRIERSGEQTAVVAERLWNQDENVRQVCPFYAHLKMLS